MENIFERKMKERMEADPEMEKILEMQEEWTQEQRRRVAGALVHAAALPGIRVDRVKFLSEALKKQCPTRNVWEAVSSTPQKAGFAMEDIDAAADRVIREETMGLTAFSAVSGIPKGWFILMSVPADIAQYYARMLRLVQKMHYLYGGEELTFEGGKATEETKERLLELMGAMYGETDAKETIGTISTAISTRFESKTNSRIKKRIMSAGPIQNATTYINQKVPVTKVITSAERSVIPYGKMLASGIVSYTAFRDMAKQLKGYLTTNHNS